MAMRRNDKSWMELDELLEPFLPVEHEQTGTAVAVEFRNRLVKLEQQVMSQYTAMAAYATIAKTDSEAVKVEARADLDRSQSTVIGLIEKLRNEVNTRLDGLERRSANGDMTADGVSRLSKVENDLAEATAAVQQLLQENQELRTQIAGLVEHKMQEQGWLVSSGSAEALYLR
jgi:cell division septum initiation protein DivIVA